MATGLQAERNMPASASAPIDDDADRVLIVGGGMAGSMLALVLGRAGVAVTLFDPHASPAPAFRAEKLVDDQVALIEKLGALDCFEAACWPADGDPLAYPAANRPSLTDCGAPNHEWVAAVRRAWPDTVRFVQGSVDHIETSDRIQHVDAGGQRFSGRLVVLASGQAPQLSEALGLTKRSISAAHSMALGFSLSVDPPIPARTLEAPFGSRIGYASLFPMPGELRVNVFSYRGLDDPWIRWMRRDPVACLCDTIPGLAAQLAGRQVLRRCEARVIDLAAIEGAQPHGVVRIGDAFQAPCPASGTGMLKTLNDIDLLANTYLPGWLAGPSVAREVIAAFYADHAKRRVDDAALAISLRCRQAAVSTSLYWRIRRRIGRLKRAMLPH
jgi:2-polyprenyl-6-methoxyphenol hydroxylase-like FAD-dependent oxidoreductase